MLDTRAGASLASNPVIICDPTVQVCDAGHAGISTGQSGTDAAGKGGSNAGTGSLPVSGIGAAGMSMPVAGAAGTMSGPQLMDNGIPCTADDQCKSNNCDRVCCSAGDCCITPSDCNKATAGSPNLTCNDPAKCQGASGNTVECNKEFRCVTKGGDNDSACDSKIVANDCGAFLPIYCNGSTEQTAPVCPTTCTSNADCDGDAHCTTGLSKVCVKDTLAGGACSVDGDCATGHCNHSICCADGDCCTEASQCPASYSGAATCTQATCQGTRKAAACMTNMCTSVMMDDDSACLKDSEASDCEGFLSVKCTGGVTQPVPMCLAQCTNNSQCDAGEAYCNTTTRGCEAKLEDGQPCQNNNACVHNYCAASNKRCCEDTNGECCTLATQCTGATTTTTMCSNVSNCTGTMVTTAPACQNTRCVMKPTSTPIPAPAAPCTGMMHTCPTGYKSLACPAVCQSRCTDDSICDVGNRYHCIGNTCKIGCNTPADCDSGEVCMNNQCTNPPPVAGTAG